LVQVSISRHIAAAGLPLTGTRMRAEWAKNINPGWDQSRVGSIQGWDQSPRASTPLGTKNINPGWDQSGINPLARVLRWYSIRAAMGTHVSAEPSHVLVRLERSHSKITSFCGGAASNERSLSAGFDAADEAIAGYLAKNHRVSLGEESIARIRSQLSAPSPDRAERSLDVRGRNQRTGLSVIARIDPSSLWRSVLPPLTTIVSAVSRAISELQGSLEPSRKVDRLKLTGIVPAPDALIAMLREATGLPVEVIAPDLNRERSTRMRT
jgi:rod shape-determining protein MreB and related proteins